MHKQRPLPLNDSPTGVSVSCGERAGSMSFTPRILAVALAVVTLAGCTKVGTGGSSRNAFTKPGLVRLVDLAEPDSLNPVIGNQQIEANLASLWGAVLFRWTDRNTFEPELATTLPTLANGGISADGRTITYHLRSGVTWHDGAPFTASDVIFSWRAVMNKRNNVASTVGFDLITAIDRTDDQTIVVHLKSRWAPFVATFFGPSSTPIVILPEHLLAKYPDINSVAYNSAPIGTGPYTVDRWQRGSKIVFRAYPHYWRGAPKVGQIWYTPIPNQNTIVTILRSHGADLEYRGGTATYEQLKNIPGYATRLTPFTTYGQIGLNLKSPKLADVAVRRALWEALNTNELLRNVSHGVNTVAFTDQPPFLWAYNPNVTHYPYDPAKARTTLDAAGWKIGTDGIRAKNGVRLSLDMGNAAGSANGNAIAVVAQRNWHDVGIETTVKNYTTSLFFASFGAGGILQTGKFDVAFYSWENGVDPDDSTLWMCDQMPPGGQNIYHYCNHELDAQEHLALGSYDQAVRKKAYDRIQAILATDVPTVLTWYDRQISVVNTDLKNFKPPHAQSSFWNAYEWEI